jgi:hypothetical protein
VPEAAGAYDPRSCTRADLAVWAAPAQTHVGSLTGEELIEVHRRWLARREIEVFPAVDPGTLDPKRVYRIAMTPSLSYGLRERERNLTGVEAGPEVRVEEVLAEVFGRAGK